MATPYVVTPALQASILRLHHERRTQAEIASALSLDVTTVGRWLRKLLGVETPAWIGKGRVAIQQVRSQKPEPPPVIYPENPTPLKEPCEYEPGEAARFWNKVAAPNEHGCRLWLASTKGGGYGQVGTIHTPSDAAHRVAWRLTYGPIQEGMNVNHRCDIRPCVEPTHLWRGTQDENMADMAAKGRRRGKAGKRGEDNVTAELTWEKVRQLRHLRETKGLTYAELAKRFKISTSQVSNIVTGRQWIE